MTLIPNEDRKTLLLTSASRGIGHATVKRFSSAGWRVISCSRQAFPEDCPWEAGPENHIQVDLADSDSTVRAVAEIKERLRAQGSKLNALVNNAGVSPKGEDGRRLSSLDTPVAACIHSPAPPMPLRKLPSPRSPARWPPTSLRAASA